MAKIDTLIFVLPMPRFYGQRPVKAEHSKVQHQSLDMFSLFDKEAFRSLWVLSEERVNTILVSVLDNTVFLRIKVIYIHFVSLRTVGSLSDFSRMRILPSLV